MTSSPPNSAQDTADLAPAVSLKGAALRVRRISSADLMAALKAGYSDFLKYPTQLIFLALIYPLAGLFLARLSFGYDVLPLLFPLVAGFALLGPLTAVGLYEISRRREEGLPNGWSHAFDVLRSPNIASIAVLGLVLLVLFGLWLLAAMGIYHMTFGGYEPTGMGSFLDQVVSTPQGWQLIVIGNLAGFVFAALAMSLSVVSLPLLVDRPVSLGTAVRTSFAAVVANPGTIALWGLVVAGCLALGTIPLFAGLAVALPVLGHATWHLYRRIVV